MQIEKALNKPEVLKSLCGVKRSEFDYLCEDFDRLEKERREGRQVVERQRAVGGGRKGHLSTAEEKLFFILLYVRIYPTQELAAFLFGGVHKSQICRWVKLYLPMLEAVLGHKAVLPARKIQSVEEFNRLFLGLDDVFVDGTERQVLRPKNPKNAKRRYSGKKGEHTRKNIVMCDENQQILYLSPTKNGRSHDKKLTDAADLFQAIPERITKWVDRGFQGVQKLCDNVMIPKKASKNHPLSDEDKQESQLISAIRITAEHAIRRIRRFGAACQTLRSKNGQDDQFTNVAAGLSNLNLLFK